PPRVLEHADDDSGASRVRAGDDRVHRARDPVRGSGPGRRTRRVLPRLPGARSDAGAWHWSGAAGGAGDQGIKGCLSVVLCPPFSIFINRGEFMKVGRLVTQFGYSLTLALVLTGATASRALAQDHEHLMVSNAPQTDAQKKQANELVATVREVT